MKKIVLAGLFILLTGSIFVLPAFAYELISADLIKLPKMLLAADNSGPIPIGYPTLSVGYTDQNFGFKTFLGTVGFYNLSSLNLVTADAAVAVFANILNGGTPASTATVTGTTKIAALNHASSFLLYPGGATSPFPSIWVKGTAVNPATGLNSPTTYISGTDANKYYQTGLTIQAPYWDAADYQWTVYVYANKDVLSQTAGPVTGKILDPRVSTMRWFPWQDDAAGSPAATWGVWNTGEPSVTMFNTLPLISDSATAAQIKAFLTGTTGVSTPETAGGYPAILGMPQAGIPNDGQFYYNVDRNLVLPTNANGFAITNRSQIGLAYASPADYRCHRTEYLHAQFIAIWPVTGVGVSAGSKSCNINIYQRTVN